VGTSCGEQPPERGCERCERHRANPGIVLDAVELLLMMTGDAGKAHTTALMIAIVRTVVLAVQLVGAAY
jgi:hypothetical protein